MVRFETIEDKVYYGPVTPRLIPKAFALIPHEHLPALFLEQANPWIPTPTLDTMHGMIETTLDHSRTVGLTCDRTGQRHLDALEYELTGEHGLSILTIKDEPVAALKHRKHGQQNIIAFRYVESADGTYPLIPGAIYTAPAGLSDAAERTSKRTAFLAIDRIELYPETMHFEQTCPATSRRKYSTAEQRFTRIVERAKTPMWARWFDRTARMRPNAV